ncbi:MAG: molecular chaperone HtpG, partial [Pseudomonadota bacterium]
TKEEMGFQSEVTQLLDLVINSLYSNREIFLRELVSNASDAVDKLRFNALSDDNLYGGDSKLEIHIDFSEELHTITVKDNGIGMSREEVISNLGTIAKSGTKEFFGALSGDAQQDSQLIGQFGVGFYASFIVADRVVVTSRRADLEEGDAVRWESDGKGGFTVETVTRKKRGTEIVLHLKEDAREFANAYQLRQLIKKYSDHISTEILMPKEGEDAEGFEAVNSATALWTRPKSDIKDDEYQAFYKHISHDFEDAESWVHTKAEGKFEYTSLFFIPKRPPFDLFDRDASRGVKLYVQRVFIMDDAEQLLPAYLRFIRGIVDTADLPLNVSREILQHNKAIDSIRGASVKKILGLVEKIAKGDSYADFWQNFGRVLKEGIVEDTGNQESIAKLLRFASSKDAEAGETVSLEKYLEGMIEGQEEIYFLTGENLATVKSSPHLEIFEKKGIEVLLLCDPIDEWLVSHLTTFQDKPLKSILHGQLNLPGEESKDDTEDSEEKNDQQTDGFIKQLKEVLGDSVKDVRASSRLTSSPSCLVSDEHDMSANLQRILKASGQELPESKRILEINTEHALVEKLEETQDEEAFAKIALVLLDQAALVENGRLEDPSAFVNRVNELLLQA